MRQKDLRRKKRREQARRWSSGFSEGSGERIDQRAKHFIGCLGDFDAQFHLELALGHLDHVAGQIRLLAAVYRTQTIDLNLGGLTGDRTLDGVVGDLTRSLIDTVLPLSE